MILKCLTVLALTVLITPLASGSEPWQAALGSMPIGAEVTELNGSNAVRLMLGALQSNNFVKGLVFMPCATDEFYFFHRASAKLPKQPATLLDAVTALQSQTRIHPAFRPPLLLLHTDEDQLQPVIQAQNELIAEKLRAARFVPHAFYNDRDWDFIQPILRKSLKVEILPAKYSSDSWHFYRHSFAGWNLNGWEAIEAVTLAGKTQCKIEKQGGLSLRRTLIVFEQDKRVPDSTLHKPLGKGSDTSVQR